MYTDFFLFINTPTLSSYKIVLRKELNPWKNLNVFRYLWHFFLGAGILKSSTWHKIIYACRKVHVHGPLSTGCRTFCTHLARAQADKRQQALWMHWAKMRWCCWWVLNHQSSLHTVRIAQLCPLPPALLGHTKPLLLPTTDFCIKCPLWLSATSSDEQWRCRNV